MFCVPGLVFGEPEGVWSRFLILRSRTRFRRYRGRRVSISCFALSGTFSAIPRASHPVFFFCTTRLVFKGTDGVVSRFRVLRSPTHFWRYRQRRVPFSSFTYLNSSSAVPRLTCPVFFVLLTQISLRCFRVRRVPFSMFYAPGVVSRGNKGVWSHFHVLRSQTRFRRYHGRRVPFSCFAQPDSFSAVRRVSGPVFMFGAP
jgi:hypothetical protein